MLKKIVLLTPIIYSLLLAVEINISTTKDTNVTNSQIEQLTLSLKEKRFMIEKESAKKLIYENRLIANNFLEQNKIPQSLQDKIILFTEDELTKLATQKEQESFKINNEVIESYYKTHKNDFKKDRTFEVTSYIFETFDEANDFYAKHKTNPSNAQQYAKEHNITSISDKLEFNKIYSLIKLNIKLNDEKDYLIHPLNFKTKFTVTHIIDFEEKGFKELGEVKEVIVKILLSTKAQEARENILKTIESK